MKKSPCYIAVGIVCAAAAAVLAVRAPKGVSTDLYALVSPSRGNMLRAIADNLSGEMRFLAIANDFDVAKGALAELNLLPPPLRVAEAMAALADHGAGLLSPTTRELLLSGRHGEVAAAALARLYGPVPPVFSVKCDPFMLMMDWFMSVQGQMPEGWTLREGLPTCERNGRFHVVAAMDRAEAPEPLAAMEAVRRFNSAHSPGVVVHCSGTPFHVAVAEERSRKEIGVLSALSCAAVFLLGWLLLRRASFAFALAGTLGVSFLVAAGAVFAAFDKPHVLTFVFGTSLIGLSVDYVYHALAERGEAAGALVRDLSRALGTTCACFAPFFLSHVAVLRQMALFTVAGLLAAYVFTCLFLRK